MGSFREKTEKFIWYLLTFLGLVIIKFSSGLILINWTKSIQKISNNDAKESKISGIELVDNNFLNKKVD